MAEIVNLRQARKNKARAEREVTAAQNRVEFGRTKAERKQTTALNELEQKRLDQHETSPPSPLLPGEGSKQD
jgi:hypothetical protein